MTDFEKLILEELRDLRSEVSDMRADIAAMKVERSSVAPGGRALARDSGLTISAATLGGGLLWLLQHWAGK